MQQTTSIAAVFMAVCALALGQGQLRMMPMIPFPPPMVPGINLPRIPIMPAPWHLGGAWTRNNIFGIPLFPGGIPSGQMWSTGPLWGQQWSTLGQNGQRPIISQNGQWFSSRQNGFNSQWPVNSLIGQFSPNGLNGQLSVNDQNGQFSPNGLNGQLSVPVNGQNGQWTDQSHLLPNSLAINGQQGNTFTTTDSLGAGISNGNSDPWGIYNQLAVDSSFGTQPASKNQGALNQQTGFDNGFPSGFGQTGWAPMDGFQNGNQNLNNGFTSPTSGSASNFGVNPPPRGVNLPPRSGTSNSQWLKKK